MQQRNRDNRKGAIVRFTSIIIQLMEKATLNLKACFPMLGHREGCGQAAIQRDTCASRPETDRCPALAEDDMPYTQHQPTPEC